jgi:hypothetical protein
LSQALIAVQAPPPAPPLMRQVLWSVTVQLAFARGAASNRKANPTHKRRIICPRISMLMRPLT